MEDFKTYITESTKFLEHKLHDYLKNDEQLLRPLFDSINHSLFSGGKRIRPIFCFAVGEIFDLNKEELASVGCALEMVHTATLILDDLPCMDDAKLRRGKAANHIVYGEDTAILASFGLLMKAYEIVADGDHLADDKKVRIIKEIAKATGANQLIGGQFADLEYSNKQIDYAILEFIHSRKTASLFIASGKTAAIVGNADETQLSAIEEFFKNIGFAFQVLDDLLDFKGKTEKIGKTAQNDSGNFVIIYGEKKSKQIIQESTNKAIEAIKIFKGKNHKLIALAEMLNKRNT
jgi:geranylgeranyl diphosphate synthase, type II